MSSSDAVYFSKVVIAENRYITAIPINIIVVGVTFLNMENTTMMDTGIRENRNALSIKPTL